MRCPDWKELLAPHLSGDLSDRQRREAEEHLRSCARCQVEVNGLASLWDDLGRLREPAVPSERLRETLRAAVRVEEGVKPTRTWLIPLLASTLAALAFLAGFLTRTAGVLPGGEPAGPRWVLLLYERPGARSESLEESRRVVAEYKAWARRLAGEGKLVGGEKLMDAGSLLTSTGFRIPPSDRSRLGGFFVIAAKDAEEANAIARSCPHLARGGEVELRQIDPV